MKSNGHIYSQNICLMSFMFCLRNWILSSKRPISAIVRSSHQAWSNQRVRNEKPVFTIQLLFFPGHLRFQPVPARYMQHWLICFPLMVQKYGTKPWHMWGVLVSMSVNICDFWGSGCGTRFYNWQKHVLLIPPDPFESVCHVWAHRNLESFHQTRAEHLHCQHHWPQIRGFLDSYWDQLGPARLLSLLDRTY